MIGVNQRKTSWRLVTLELVMILWALIIIYPLIMIVLMSLKTNGEIIINPLGIPSQLAFENFVTAWQYMDYLNVLKNSVILTVFTVGIGTLAFSMAAYAIVRAKKGRLFFNVLFYLFLAGLVVPPQVTLVPLVVWLRTIRLSNTFPGLIGVMVAGGAASGVFLIKNFINTIPISLEESAYIDGCAPIGVFFRILLPLLTPIVVTLIIINSIGAWNDFMHPLLLLQGKESRTVPLAVFFFRGEFITQWNVLFAGLVLSLLPILILYFFLQRYIMGGLVGGAVKG